MDAGGAASHDFVMMSKSVIHPAVAMALASAIVSLVLVLPAAAQDSSDYSFSNYSGAELYQRFCASCHGTTAEGDGPVASTFNVAVPDLTRLAARHRGEFPLERVRRIVDGRDVPAAHGARRMPVWGYEFAANTISDPDAGIEQATQLIDRVVEFLRSVQVRKKP